MNATIDGRTVFLTFGDKECFRHQLTRISCEAEALKVFDQITVADQSYFEPSFREFHKDFLYKNPKGFGCYIWKPHIILKALNSMEEGDILVYADAGCHLNPKGRKRLEQTLKYLETSPMACYTLDFNISMYTKMDCLLKLDPALNTPSKNMVVAGILFIRKCTKSMNLVKQWNDAVKDIHLFDDTPSQHTNSSDFIMHRHDQSVLSIFVQRVDGITLIPDESYFRNFLRDGTPYPIWAVRSDTALIRASRFPYPFSKLYYKTSIRLMNLLKRS